MSRRIDKPPCWLGDKARDCDSGLLQRLLDQPDLLVAGRPELDLGKAGSGGRTDSIGKGTAAVGEEPLDAG